MILRSELKINSSGKFIRLPGPVLLMGSCFSENIGLKLGTNKFKVLVNPFGTLYNPHSIFSLIENSARENMGLNEKEILFHQDVYRYLGFHSSVSGRSKNDLVENSNIAFQTTRNFLASADWLIITPGTSIVYTYKETGNIVANCHKLPSGTFNRQMMWSDEIILEFEKMHSVLKSLNPGLKIILTLSPVRHLREGFEANQVSKSILRIACDLITNQYEDVYYFPAYEIMMDDLRDYRFYAEDLIHPNALAIEYIWEKFGEAFFDRDTLHFINEWKLILKALQHRPIHPGTREHHKFIQQTIDRLRSLEGVIDVEEEIKRIIINPDEPESQA